MSYREEEQFTSEKLDVGLWKKILKMLLENKKNLFLALFFVLLEAVIGVILPVLNRYAIDVFYQGHGSTETILKFTLLYGGLVAVQAFLIYEFIYRSGLIEMDISYQIRQNVMEKLQTLPFSYYDKTPTGWIMARMTSDVSRLSEILSWSFNDLVWGFLVMILLLIVMFTVNWKLALIILVIVPMVYFVSAWFQKRILQNYRSVRAENSKITHGFSEGITGAKTTKTMGLEAIHYSEFKNNTMAMRSKSIHAVILSALYMPLITLISSLGNAGIIYVGGNMALQGVIQIGTLILFTQYAERFFEPLRNISNVFAQLQMAQASAERVLSLLEQDSTLVDRPDVIEKYGTILNPNESVYEPIVGDIEFKDVDFYYQASEPILNKFNLTVQPKQRIALVGETGSGKSTIVNLICRFYEPISGSILIDGVDYRERSIGWLHSHLGYVLQAPHLFSGSVRDNIAYGKPDASDEDVIKASKLVDAHRFIMELEDGYQTDVGEGGNRLSTGQKQLISFARAILVDPSIFILDEATASIDTETEAIIQNAVETVLKEKTSFIIAHRLSTIVNADRILVIDKGQILEDGNHHSLMSQKGRYYELYMNQFNEKNQTNMMNTLTPISE
ncbi:ABC transporter ATP-binding protein [Erysipelothrix rhusiopathiae]|uniref:ABC transporter ATP-binding protein n=1 Tax=Erysipelothrix rhusiopathiae TaxID=1648 RepID=UPI00033485AA|nr:ABC transporter ATP-binding protein [Erysipelothrix rhusiopathiae]AGN23656.1 ABC transporter permease/ATP-binding protein [Erysipelothrix rhusiopathiae SY1027]AMS11563.1 ABC transporter ATP-binding protein [Erysipelothrix rhusiopathiae]AOO68062.1 ABC transporter ATP-binding protein [Erysipelothrix rhusiopathiae]AWU41090.1 ABC transporter ATP-binding protein [Erysipelothrix rhusiopathiae]MDE8033012.1 ABC transporter ATP-binding protein [Erysipelothrix rhusiopathiae]